MGIEARLVNEFFTLIENEKDGDEESITFVVHSAGRIFQQKNAKKISKPGKSASKAKMVKDFFSMIDRKQKHDDAKVESFAGNFWKMKNNSEVRPERKQRGFGRRILEDSRVHRELKE